MITEAMIPEILERIKNRLKEFTHVPLSVQDREYKLDEDWLYVAVRPSKPGVRGSDYADALGQIERELHADDIDHVLLVPTIDDPDLN